MKFQITFKPDWVEVKTSGSASLAGFRAFGEAVAADPRWPPGQKLLIDHSELDLRSMSTDDIALLGQQSRRDDHPLKDCPRGAFFVPDKLQFGLGRLWQNYRDDPGNDHTRMFNSREAAEAWLRQGDEAE